MTGPTPTMLFLLVSLASSPMDKLPMDLNLEPIRGLVVQHDGRWPPLDTLARDVVESVTGKARYEGRDPVLWLLAWTFEPDTWKQYPLIPVPNAELRAELGLAADQNRFSYTQLQEHAQLQDLIHEVGSIGGRRKLDPLENKVLDLSGKLTTLSKVFQGQMIRFVPASEAMAMPWQTIGAASQKAREDLKPAADAWSALQAAFRADNATGFTEAAGRLAAILSHLPTSYRPDADLIKTELLYNRLRPFQTAWMIMGGAAVLAALAAMVARGWAKALAVVAMIAGFVVLTYGLSLRWTVAGRIPAANMYESLLFLSWGMGIFAIVSILLMRDRLIPLTASLMGALTLFLADTLPLDGFIRPIAPVLMDTVWMSIHVPVIMVSYSVLALAALIAHVQFVLLAVTPGRRPWIAAVDGLHGWYMHAGCVLLGAGIVTGSMWAASSWGRYWGWDPKEVWSLIAFLAYLAILHLRLPRESVPGWVYGLVAVLAVAIFAMLIAKLAPITPSKLLALAAASGACALFLFASGPLGIVLKSVLAFWMIIMTYVGVNYILGIGLHSYGFGTGAVVRYVFLVGGIDLLFITVCTLIHLLRTKNGTNLEETSG